jgi:hypothetical protein
MAFPLLRAWNLQLESSVKCLVCVYYLQPFAFLSIFFRLSFFTFLYLAHKVSLVYKFISTRAGSVLSVNL